MLYVSITAQVPIFWVRILCGPSGLEIYWSAQGKLYYLKKNAYYFTYMHSQKQKSICYFTNICIYKKEEEESTFTNCCIEIEYTAYE